eukprot:610230-Rhodomonas_salina.1
MALSKSSVRACTIPALAIDPGTAGNPVAVLQAEGAPEDVFVEKGQTRLRSVHFSAPRRQCHQQLPRATCHAMSTVAGPHGAAQPRADTADAQEPDARSPSTQHKPDRRTWRRRWRRAAARGSSR